MSGDGTWLEDWPAYSPVTVPVVDDAGNITTVLRLSSNVQLISEDEFEEAAEIEDEF